MLEVDHDYRDPLRRKTEEALDCIQHCVHNTERTGRLSVSAADTAGAFSLLLSHFPTGDHVPRHVHDTVDESFYILDGQYRIQCGEQAWSAAAGDFVFLPRGVPHSYDVVHGPARKLIIAVPGGIEDFFDDLVNGVDPATITHRHGVRFLD